MAVTPVRKSGQGDLPIDFDKTIELNGKNYRYRINDNKVLSVKIKDK